MTASEPDIRVETREDLLYLLAEAAEIEHNLMCCYLYAGFSLRRTPGAGLTEAQARAVAGWRGEVMGVAIEEMTHLALVSNLASALGAAPHFARPNFPVQPGYHPSGVVVELAPFDRATLDHFIFLERPEGDDSVDSADFVPALHYARRRETARLMPSAQDYATVGHLYRAIGDGLRGLSAQMGEAVLFCGDPAAQVGPPEMALPGLAVVRDLASALAAVQTIVDQGEGAPEHREDSHFSRFRAIRDEYDRMLAGDPGFAPAWPAARNPVMRHPVQAEGRVFVSDPHAAEVLDVANALYGHMLRCLAASYGRTGSGAPGKAQWLDTAVGLMSAMAPVAEYLMSLPAGPEHPGVNAGMSFAMLRDVGRMPEGPGEARVVHERITQIAARAATLFPAGHALAAVPGQIAALAAPYAASGTAPAPQAAQPAPATPVPAAAAVADAAPDVAEGEHIQVSFNTVRCIHSRFCVLGAPAVFKANTPGEWIFPDKMPVEALVAVAQNCPSGAVTYVRRDGGPAEAAPPVNTAHIRENGPYAIRADMTLNGESIGYRATLCRCGASAHKPYCDGSHNAAGFKASGEPATRPSEPLAVRDGVLDIAPRRNGPLHVSGNLEICAGTGRTVDRVSEANLCRCGGSANKPFCDGTHAKIGFTAP